MNSFSVCLNGFYHTAFSSYVIGYEFVACKKLSFANTKIGNGKLH